MSRKDQGSYGRESGEDSRFAKTQICAHVQTVSTEDALEPVPDWLETKNINSKVNKDNTRFNKSQLPTATEWFRFKKDVKSNNRNDEELI